MGMKAWTVGSDDGDVGTVIVFANSRTEAKKIGKKSDWLVDLEWTEVCCRRLPEMDDKNERQEPHFLDGESLKDQRMMRRLGWCEINGSYIRCDLCNLYHWEALPESQLTEFEDGKLICRECTEKKP
jgi:hypothetical protein